eukprot:365372-Chlamydomonas_euryale.AAC.11
MEPPSSAPAAGVAGGGAGFDPPPVALDTKASLVLLPAVPAYYILAKSMARWGPGWWLEAVRAACWKAVGSAASCMTLQTHAVVTV